MGRLRIAVAAWFAVVAIPAVSLAAVAPKVRETFPVSGATDVDPKVNELAVLFDQDMSGGFSWTGGGDTFPELTGKPRWTDQRTCVLPVKLKPGTEYWIGINSLNARNFKGANKKSAIPYMLHFRTTGDRPSPTPATSGPIINPGDELVRPTQNELALTNLRQLIDDNYSYRDRLGLDWEKIIEGARPQLEPSETSQIFAGRLATLLAQAKDLHMSVGVRGKMSGIYSPDVKPNFDLDRLRKLVPGFEDVSPGVAVGHWEDGTVYIWIRGWVDAEDAEAATDALVGATAAVIDVRGNGGGDELLARSVAGRFIRAPGVYAKDRIRKDGKWSEVYDRVVKPIAPHFTGKVVVLQGPANFSSNESFIQMMQLSATTIGDTTGGSSGRPQQFALGNGVNVNLPSWEDLTRDGKPVEGVGLKPDVEVAWDAAGPGDPVLEKALEIVRRK